MKVIPSFQEFEKNIDLNEKISPQLAESLANWFSEDPRLNEAKFFDSIKNFLSKTFLGSLSYINIIDKVRGEVLKLEKELVSKNYEYQDEIASLKGDLKDLSAEGNESSIAAIRKKLELKSKEYESYKKMTETRIDKALETLKEAIKGNRRRNEYYQAGKAQDEVELAEFEYTLAKRRAASAGSNTSLAKSLSDDLKKKEEEIKKLKEEAERRQQEIQSAQKEEAGATGGSTSKNVSAGTSTLSEETPDFNQSYKTAKGTRSLIVYYEKQLVTLKDSLHDVKKEAQRRMVENQIKKLQNDLKVAKEVLRGHLDKKILDSQKKHEQQMALQKKAAEEAFKNAADRQKVKQEAGIEETGTKDNKTKEVKAQEKKAKTEKQVNQNAKETFKKIVG